MRFRLVSAVLLVAVGVGAVIFVVVRPGAASGADDQYLTSPVTRTTVTDSVAANGALEPSTRYGLSFGSQPKVLGASDASASNASGDSSGSGSTGTTWPVTAVKVSAGESVKKGAVLATADATSVRQQLSQLSYQLAVAKLQLTQATDDLAAATTEQQTRQAQMAYYNAKSQVSQLTAQQADLNAQLARASLTAPADGVIEAVNVAVGADAPSSSAIILDAGGLQASVTVAEADLSRVSKGQSATVTISAVDGSATGTVASIAPTGSSGNNAVVTYAVVVSLKDVPTKARAGMTASVAITIATAQDVLAVPAIALQTAGTGYTVRVMGADGTVTTHNVDVGLLTSDLAEITSGLTEGQNVVIGVSNTRTSTTGTTGGLGGGGLGGALGGGGFRTPTQIQNR